MQWFSYGKDWRLSTAPWWTPTLMLNSSLNWPFTCTQNLAFSYIALTARITHSWTPALLIAHRRTFLGTWSKGFCKVTKAKYRGSYLPRCFSCIWHRMKIASVVILSISTWDLITESRTLSMIFISWSSNFKPL